MNLFLNLLVVVTRWHRRRLLINVMYVIFQGKQQRNTNRPNAWRPLHCNHISSRLICVCRANQVYIRSERGVQSQCVQQQRTSVMRVFYMCIYILSPLIIQTNVRTNEEATQLNVLPFFMRVVQFVSNFTSILSVIYLSFECRVNVLFFFGKFMFLCLSEMYALFF